MKLHVVKDKDTTQTHVWVSLPETATSDLRHSTEAFIIASGQDRASALLNAWNVLGMACAGCELLGKGRRTSMVV